MRSAAIDLRFGTAEDWPAIQALRLEQTVRNGQNMVPIPDGSVWAVAYDGADLTAAFAMSEQDTVEGDRVYLVSDMYCEQSPRGRRALAGLFRYLYDENETRDVVSAIPAGNVRMLEAVLHRGWEVESYFVRRRKKR